MIKSPTLITLWRTVGEYRRKRDDRAVVDKRLTIRNRRSRDGTTGVIRSEKADEIHP